jgi:hypothetical protein
MKKDIYTHIGMLEGADARTNSYTPTQIELKETKTMWIATNGLRFKKTTGYVHGDWPMWQINLDSIKLK